MNRDGWIDGMDVGRWVGNRGLGVVELGRRAKRGGGEGMDE